MQRPLLVLFFTVFSIAVSASEFTEIYLVRHGEKVDNSSNSDLTDLGKSRAQTFSALLSNENVTHVFSTDFLRTKNTADPTAKSHNLEIEIYNADRDQEFAEKLIKLSGTILVVGHSNTIPNLVNRLTGENFEDLDESVYDKIYRVTYDQERYISLLIFHSEPRSQ